MVDHIRNELAQFRHDAQQALEAIELRPLLKGISHLVACIAAVFGCVVLAAHAGHPLQLTASLIYGIGLSLALGTSAMYHRVKWKSRAHRLMRKLDHSMIFILIASSYTPFVLLALDGSWRVASIVSVWVLCTSAIIMRMAIRNLPRVVMAILGLGLGGGAIILFPALHHHIPPSSLTLLAVGGGLYIMGAIVYIFKRPNPFPRVFGFHEVFHAFVVAAAVCHFVAIWPLVTHTNPMAG